ncbi:DUF6232 family protein [Deinococcus cellulosilyticus]|uniref:Uncharacterized protein n=1 Tax=Deinococcus cellulosilyticus (strain DSM 18568 / NBRC 106333 / KACC 11606 / 5516J-15) TaxID=1223518 RepID=A0A511NCU1_DEIC1|nr:DUF6232 family protein [Deinococcus cellulosilyticus]GEM50161.1 hypothetical protein DC3_57960 [Deinococcus cellulosilyticus NBRC 106333 = KACC 11606]
MTSERAGELLNTSVQDGILRIGEKAYFLRNITSVNVKEVYVPAKYSYPRVIKSNKIGCLYPFIVFVISNFLIKYIGVYAYILLIGSVIFSISIFFYTKTIILDPGGTGYILEIQTNSGVQEILASRDRSTVISLARQIEEGVSLL